MIPAYSNVSSGQDLDEGIYSPAANAYRQTIVAGGVSRRLGALIPPNYPVQTRDNEFYGVNAEIAADMGVADLVVIPAWRRASINQIVSGPGFPVFLREKDEQFSVEARLNGTLAKIIDYNVGGYYFDETNAAHYTVNQSPVVIFQDLPLTRNPTRHSGG
jgi:iron complex outermembrane recepter protein